MRARSWMAALALIVGLSTLVELKLSAQERNPTDQTGQAGEPKPKPDDSRPSKATDKLADSRARAAKLSLVIAGLGRDGCDVEIKPANASCKFRAVNEKGMRRAANMSRRRES